MSDKQVITPVILSGGSGTRLWPLSTNECPKQFLTLTGPLSLFQQTVERCNDKALFATPIIVSGASHRDLVVKQLDEIKVRSSKLILEPCARNTAPAIALAALACTDPRDIMLVMPSDHIISDVPAFQKAVKQSLSLAEERWLVTFGIAPTGPETGYGYIEQGDIVVDSENSFAARRFVEKPAEDDAEKMLSRGGFHWNAGIFLFRADAYLAALGKYAPEILQAAIKSMKNCGDEDFVIRPDAHEFGKSTSVSIDYAVMEKSEKVAVTPVNPGWSDVGSWDSLFDINATDNDPNVTFGRVHAISSKNIFVHASGIEVSTFGLENLIVVANEKQVMIIPRGQSQNVKRILQERNNIE
ncbi:mannose-1-phosphate guanylyltransferase/mannose-6-phosphate isomerase [Sphingorhabdus sp. YGSMI21]|uniref:mannose-1-phosphate guanylyltransferase/mannose-6-phosphate isomerase n=1 Tax=Sphingorhabdus sp. YGSMI21 TaxID=2077182 RepID=UPI000C1EBAEA|nr:mannose-1-phosphate guanylyltransferase/mannose-6-phosphate isomerase [Sphingorhabdus sp. YGSMI21]ATW03104.1 mannose-1-phosphate guanylyltransferase/mannose-6-phosphate isomerase [Sphingorhabdus sp. YGSMI21]